VLNCAERIQQQIMHNIYYMKRERTKRK
jgi:hypothetical protein